MSAWKELGISLRGKLYSTYSTPEEPWGVLQTVTYPGEYVVAQERLGEIILKFVDEIPYSLTDTPIFQKMWKEDYNYYGSIPNM